MRNNILLVGLLIIIAGVIVMMSFIMKPMPMDVKVQKPPAAESKLPEVPAPGTVAQAPEVTPSIPPTPTAPVPPTQALETVKSVKPQLEQAFDKGLTWLMSKQLPSGSFPDLENKDDVAFTAMALIIIGEAGPLFTLPGDVPSIQLKYEAETNKALAYLYKNVQDNGSIMDAGKVPSFDIYKTSLAIVALKAMRMHRTADEAKIDGIIAKAMEYLQASQYGPESSDKDMGGWGYQEKGTEKTPNPNLSTASYVIDALYKAGLAKDSETYKRAVDFLMKLQDSTEHNTGRVTGNSGGFVYSPTESKAGETTTADGQKILKPYGSMTYAGLLSFIYAYVDKNDPRVQSAYNWIRANYTLEENPGLRTDAAPNLGKQGLFYYYHTFAKALSAYGDKTITTTDNTQHLWANELVTKLALIQSADGSWKNENSRWWEDMPILATSYSLMSLNLCRKSVYPE
ncbi:MAG TPA: prenyltransferase/squalene oxidase repeat-containing protein [Planctomycetota bacterium]|nr:prenyltransferase/squalene oxidase repeat-containing protein [Planctomycetota bacterium]